MNMTGVNLKVLGLVKPVPVVVGEPDLSGQLKLRLEAFDQMRCYHGLKGQIGEFLDYLQSANMTSRKIEGSETLAKTILHSSRRRLIRGESLLSVQGAIYLSGLEYLNCYVKPEKQARVFKKFKQFVYGPLTSATQQEAA